MESARDQDTERTRGRGTARATDEEVEALAATATPLSVAVLRWAAGRDAPAAAQVELDHQRRMVALRADGTIAVLCPVVSDTVAGIVVMTPPVEDAARIMGADPCVRAGMMTCEVHACLGFPGDAIGTPPECGPHVTDGTT